MILERGNGGRKKGRETSMWESNIDQLTLCTLPNGGLNPWPRHVPWSGIEPATLWSVIHHTTNWATLGRASYKFFDHWYSYYLYSFCLVLCPCSGSQIKTHQWLPSPSPTNLCLKCILNFTVPHQLHSPKCQPKTSSALTWATASYLDSLLSLMYPFLFLLIVPLLPDWTSKLKSGYIIPLIHIKTPYFLQLPARHTLSDPGFFFSSFSTFCHDHFVPNNLEFLMLFEHTKFSPSQSIWPCCSLHQEFLSPGYLCYILPMPRGPGSPPFSSLFKKELIPTLTP